MTQGQSFLDSVTSAALHTAWESIAGPPELLELVRLVGDPRGLLPGPLPALAAMTAAVCASTLAAAALDAARTGRPARPVTVDRRAVAWAARSERFARVLGERNDANLFDPLSTFFRTADGWVRLHANYPWHRERLLRVLACDDSAAEVAAAVRGWTGERLEDALAAAGAIGYAVRGPAAWRAHPQGAAVAELPLVRTTSAGMPGRDMPAGRAMDGIRVLDLTRVIAGPVATRTLAAWGARVLRVDSPNLPEPATITRDTLSGKRSAPLDLALDDDQHRLEELLAAADLVVIGYRPGALDRFGVAPEALLDRHPHLCVITMSAWGGVGPWARRRGFDSVVQCPTGIAAETGTPERPGALPAQVLDHATGYLGAAAAMLALAGVVRGEPSRAWHLSLAQTARWLTALPRERAGPESAGPAEAPDLVVLHGGDRPIEVVPPPGQVDGLTPRWIRTTSFGADSPDFGSMQPVDLVVDVANVMGSRPDGWWRDRKGAADRLIAALDAVRGAEITDGTGDFVRIARVLAVVEGAARAAAESRNVEVVRADRDGDSAVVQVAERLAARGRPALVVTADRGLKVRLPDPVRVTGPSWLNRLLDR